MSGVAHPTAIEAPWIAFRPGVLDEQARVVGSRCPSCGARYFPSRQVCSRCLASDLETVPLSDVGTLYTYTVVRQAAPGFEVPYILGYVDLPEDVRLLGQVAGIEPEAVRLGMRLHLSVEPFGEDEDGRTVMGFRFRPEGGDDD
jgi:uncharacterized OB-fold protein